MVKKKEKNFEDSVYKLSDLLKNPSALSDRRKRVRGYNLFLTYFTSLDSLNMEQQLRKSIAFLKSRCDIKGIYFATGRTQFEARLHTHVLIQFNHQISTFISTFDLYDPNFKCRIFGHYESVRDLSGCFTYLRMHPSNTVSDDIKSTYAQINGKMESALLTKLVDRCDLCVRKTTPVFDDLDKCIDKTMNDFKDTKLSSKKVFISSSDDLAALEDPFGFKFETLAKYLRVAEIDCKEFTININLGDTINSNNNISGDNNTVYVSKNNVSKPEFALLRALISSDMKQEALDFLSTLEES